MTTLGAYSSLPTGKTSDEDFPVFDPYSLRCDLSVHPESDYSLSPLDAGNEEDKTGFSDEKREGEVDIAIVANSRPYSMQPIDPPEGHPPINFRPVMLRPLTTIALASLFLLVELGIVALVYRSGSNSQFHVTNNYIYFTARYVPSIIGTITVLLFRSMVEEFYSLAPFIAMADHKAQHHHGAPVEQSLGFMYFPHLAFTAPRLDFTLFTYISLVIALILMVPTKTALLATQQEGDTWVLIVRHTPAWVLVGNYTLMTLVTLAVTFRLYFRQTGLKWYPASLADKIALFRNMNTLSYFEKLELENSQVAVREGLFKGLHFRLGYWLIGRHGGTAEGIWYGVGVVDPDNSSPLKKPGTSADRAALYAIGFNAMLDPLLNEERVNPDMPHPSAQLNEGTNLMSLSGTRRGQDLDPASNATPPMKVNIPGKIKTSADDFCSCVDEMCRHYPYRYALFFTRLAVAIWIAVVGTSLILCLYPLGAGQVRNGFSVAHHSPHSLLFYAVVFRSLPTGFAGVFTGFLSVISTSFCFTQPFVGMYQTPGSATETILLEYSASSPLQVPLEAWGNNHWKVAWFSALSSISPIFPILVGGMFSMTDTGGRIHINFAIASYSVVLAYLFVYFISLLFAWPTKKRLLPRQFSSLLDIVAVCHRSQFLLRSDFDVSDPKTIKRHLVSRVFLRGDKYLFGFYTGTDGKKHLGFDIAESNEQPTELVEWVEPKRAKWADQLRRRRLSPQLTDP